ncbi:hypothetical protein [Tropicibacter sp. S64]|uniref:hypothetical protein n=1 Tax=Tropicibacter sp. S64 TaxID=3415122 RepID=UPI003C7D936E
MTIELDHFREAFGALVHDMPVTAAIAFPPLFWAVLTGWVFDFGFELDLMLWKTVAAAFFYARMALAWHRWQLLGEAPGRGGARVGRGDRLRYQLFATGACLGAICAAVFAMTLLAELLAVPDDALVVTMPVTAILLAAGILYLGHRLPARAIGLPVAAVPRLDPGCIAAGAVGFGLLWSGAQGGLRFAETLIAAPLVFDALFQLSNALLALGLAAYLVTAAPGTWARGQAANGTLRVTPRMRPGPGPVRPFGR